MAKIIATSTCNTKVYKCSLVGKKSLLYEKGLPAPDSNLPLMKVDAHDRQGTTSLWGLHFKSMLQQCTDLFNDQF